MAFFTANDAIELETTAEHVKRLAAAGIAGIVTHGSNGEAAHLDRSERKSITRATRCALDDAGKKHLPVIVGCGAQSTRETIQLCCDVADAGGSHVLVLPLSYYSSLLTTELIIEHFEAVAEASPLPLLIYNFPSACGGLDLSFDAIFTLAGNPSIVGVKLTCGNTGRLARIVAGSRDQASAFKTFGSQPEGSAFESQVSAFAELVELKRAIVGS